MKVLVTGATGFLGPAVIRALAARGLRAVALARPGGDRSRITGLPCEVREGDVTDRESLRGVFDGVEAVIHLAGRVAVRPSERAELKRVNVDGTRNVVEVYGACPGRGRFVHLSSVVAVGASADGREILDERSPNRQRDHGFANCETKSLGEEIVLAACRAGALDAVVLNPAMVFGAGDARKAARRGHLLAARGKLAFYTRGGVSAVGAEDVAAAIVTALSKGRAGERYILSGENLTMKKLLELYSTCAGARSPRREFPTRWLRRMARTLESLGLDTDLTLEGAVAATTFHWYEHAKATAELDFRPRPAMEAIQESVDWMRANGLLVRR